MGLRRHAIRANRHRPANRFSDAAGVGTGAGLIGSGTSTVRSIIPVPCQDPVVGVARLCNSSMLTGWGLVQKPNAFANDRVRVTKPELAPDPCVVKIAWHDAGQLNEDVPEYG